MMQNKGKNETEMPEIGEMCIRDSDYNHLQMNAFAVVSDSGTLPEESSFFASIGHPFPAVCIRTSTERPEALDKACFIRVSYTHLDVYKRQARKSLLRFILRLMCL